MRLVSAVLFVALTGSISLADDAKPADPKPEVSKRKVPLRVVRMLPETRQVLLYDKNRGTHVVAEVGQQIDGYIVDEIDGDEVTLVAENGAEVILTAPDMTWRRRAAERKAASRGAPKPDAAAKDPQPVDPYTEAGEPAEPVRSTTTDHEAGEGGVRVASASGGKSGPTAAPIIDAGPSDPYGEPDPGIAAFADAVGAPAPAPTPPPRPAKPIDPKTDEAASALASAATGSAPPKASSKTTAPTTFTVTRAEVDAALGDFGATAVTFDAKFVADGLRIDSIADGTILAKLGLRKGDVLTSVDNRPLRSFDDAANLYARAGTARGATLQVVRGGTPTTLRVTIR